jgi:4-amino-4-deoxy-L-arabinose transferase-like glycosyltransferase
VPPSKPGSTRTTTPAPVLWGALLLVLIAAFFACDIGLHPIVLWDESRVASNALEMSRTGFSLITTYDFKPDLWNTKPPLLVWLIAGCIRLFGPSEWVVRTPSFLAAMATVALVMRFSWRLARSAFVTAAATCLLALSPGFFGAHAGQSADYEMLLCLFTTAYLLLLFELVHQARPKPWRVLACALLVAGACLTKGVAGLIPGVGAALYVVVRGRWPRLFKTPWYALGGLVFAGLVGGYYLLRERAAPGYLAAVQQWELGGRFLHGLKGHVGSPAYYLVMLCLFFSFGPAPLALCAAPWLRWPRAKSTVFLVYGGYVGAAMLLVLSLSRTKIFWYLAPLYPILSIMLAIVIDRLLGLLPHRRRRPVQTRQVLVAVVAAYMLFNAGINKAWLLPRVENIAQARYGQVFAQLNRAGYRHVRTIDGGVNNDDDLAEYTPQLHFYTLAWRSRGLDVSAGDLNRPASSGHGVVVVSCDGRYLAAVSALGPPLARVAGCAAAMP